MLSKYPSTWYVPASQQSLWWQDVCDSLEALGDAGGALLRARTGARAAHVSCQCRGMPAGAMITLAMTLLRALRGRAAGAGREMTRRLLARGDLLTKNEAEELRRCRSLPASAISPQLETVW